MFHHRFPTSTLNVRNACHPFSTKDHFDNNYVLVHNGVVSNARQLKTAHEKLGITYVSEQQNGAFNDSEALMWDVALYLEGEQTKLEAKGSIAFIVIERNKEGEPVAMRFGHNANSPLKMKYTQYSLTVSSESPDKKDDFVQMNQLYTLDYKTNKLEKEYLFIPTNYTYSVPAPWKGSSNYSYQEDLLDDAPYRVEADKDFQVMKERLLADGITNWGALEQAEWEIDSLRRELVGLNKKKTRRTATADDHAMISLFTSEVRLLSRAITYFERKVEDDETNLNLPEAKNVKSY